MYHSISTDAEPGISPYYKIVTTPRNFCVQIKILEHGNYRTCSTAAMESLPPDSGWKAKKPVLITFDDGYADFYRNAYPALKERGFSATMYLPTAYIGDQRQTFNGRECLTWPEVRELSVNGVEFGSHTVTHPKLYSLNRASILDELSRSKEAIEDKISKPVHSFAYPYAFPQADAEFVRSFRDMLVAGGYRTCVTTMIGSASRRGDPLMIERLPVNDEDDPALFQAKLDGGYDWMAGLQRAVKLAKRLTGRDRPHAISM
jgi:peptidoglycan/xylan/chitin deacetylase (PgdA/CDA1 family)